ncbi:hypothetical protein BE17_05355 [Sorangium cellulosum]|uniref:Secreted protein n=1 Tax=Sorangium cellulosum TaxID=56 RepID=A0A150RW00_SORCE|nr:hypothetical protein BE17_05355 [Sorangium cellulosum]
MRRALLGRVAFRRFLLRGGLAFLLSGGRGAAETGKGAWSFILSVPAYQYSAAARCLRSACLTSVYAASRSLRERCAWGESV